jgi:hypothetical protein
MTNLRARQVTFPGEKHWSLHYAPDDNSSIDRAKAIVGLRPSFWPRYALANLGHPSIPSDGYDKDGALAAEGPGLLGCAGQSTCAIEGAEEHTAR